MEPGGLSLDVRQPALLVRRRVELEGQRPVQENAPLAVVSVTDPADRGVLQLEELPVPDRDVITDLSESLVRAVVIESGAEIEPAVGRHGQMAEPRLYLCPAFYYNSPDETL